MPSRASSELQRTAPGYRWRDSGLRILRRRNGKRGSPGPPATSLSVPAAYASSGARRSHLLGRGADYRRPTAGVHAFPRTYLAEQDGKKIGGGGLNRYNDRALPV